MESLMFYQYLKLNYLNFEEMIFCEEGTKTQITDEILIDAFVSYCKKKYRLNIVSWNQNDKLYPKHMLLGNDKGILSYIHFSFYTEKKVIHEYEDLISRVKLAYSDLDRPMFLVNFIVADQTVNIVFETNEQVLDTILNGKIVTRSIKDIKYYCSIIEEMGNLEEMINMFEDLKKFNVKQY